MKKYAEGNIYYRKEQQQQNEKHTFTQKNISKSTP